jgi:hypothetical protein
MTADDIIVESNRSVAKYAFALAGFAAACLLTGMSLEGFDHEAHNYMRACLGASIPSSALTGLYLDQFARTHPDRLGQAFMIFGMTLTIMAIAWFMYLVDRWAGVGFVVSAIVFSQWMYHCIKTERLQRSTGGDRQ